MLFGLFRVVGLTGGIASGKSTVSAELHDVYGLDIIDADKIAHDVLTRGTASFHKVVKAFGPSILQSNGEINRPLLAETVFSDAAKRSTLNTIVHPAIAYSMAWELLCHFARGTPMVILDAPLLYETGLNKVTDFVVVVSCTKEQQVVRFMSRTGSCREHAEKRVEAQRPLEWKVARAKYVIDNSKSLENTKEQVKDLVEQWNVGPTGWLARSHAFFARLLSSLRE